jgi:hypothetical protein
MTRPLVQNNQWSDDQMSTEIINTFVDQPMFRNSKDLEMLSKIILLKCVDILVFDFASIPPKSLL